MFKTRYTNTKQMKISFEVCSSNINGTLIALLREVKYDQSECFLTWADKVLVSLKRLFLPTTIIFSQCLRWEQRHLLKLRRHSIFHLFRCFTSSLVNFKSNRLWCKPCKFPLLLLQHFRKECLSVYQVFEYKDNSCIHRHVIYIDENYKKLFFVTRLVFFKQTRKSNYWLRWRLL